MRSRPGTLWYLVTILSGGLLILATTLSGSADRTLVALVALAGLALLCAWMVRLARVETGTSHQ